MFKGSKGNFGVSQVGNSSSAYGGKEKWTGTWNGTIIRGCLSKKKKRIFVSFEPSLPAAAISTHKGESTGS